MTENNTQSAECLSHLTAELEALRQEHCALKSASAMLVKTIEQLTSENAQLKELRFSDDYKKHWRMVFAGQAMQSIIETKPNFKDVAEISKSAFIVADSMIEQISI